MGVLGRAWWVGRGGVICYSNLDIKQVGRVWWVGLGG